MGYILILNKYTIQEVYRCDRTKIVGFQKNYCSSLNYSLFCYLWSKRFENSLQVLIIWGSHCKKMFPASFLQPRHCWQLLLVSVHNTVRVIHHADNVCLVTRVHRSNRNVPHCSKLAAVVQVLIFQSKKVPDKSPECKENMI